MPTARFSPRRALGAALVVLAGALPAAAPANASSVRVAPDFFGVNFQGAPALDGSLRERHLDSIAKSRIRQTRVAFSWAAIEPQPVWSGARYQFDAYDDIVEEAARRRIRMLPTIVGAPLWATDQVGLGAQLQCAGASSRRPVALGAYADLARAIANRYGRGGSFWAARPGLRELPITTYEIWNEINLRGGWCPMPQPERYAELFVEAARAIRAVDPRAAVLTGGLGYGNGQSASDLDPAQFLHRATAAQPGVVRAAGGVAALVYWLPDADEQVRRLAHFRDLLRAGGFPDTTPIVVAETGWTTHGTNGHPPVTEAERTAAYRALTERFPRTHCNVTGVLPHTWATPESNPNDVEDWYGIADPLTGVPYPSAVDYARGLALMRGELKQEPPRSTISACRGMPKPDQDGDAVRDEREYHPVNRGRVTKGGRLTVAECSVRMIFLRERIRSASGAERRLAHAYDRLRSRCVDDCRHDLLRRLERRALSTDSPDNERKRRVKHRRAVGRCR